MRDQSLRNSFYKFPCGTFNINPMKIKPRQLKRKLKNNLKKVVQNEIRLWHMPFWSPAIEQP